MDENIVQDSELPDNSKAVDLTCIQLETKKNNNTQDTLEANLNCELSESEINDEDNRYIDVKLLEPAITINSTIVQRKNESDDKSQTVFNEQGNILMQYNLG